MNTILLALLLGAAVITLAVAVNIRRKTAQTRERAEAAKARAEERMASRAFANTAPSEDPYARPYNLSDAMSVVEVDETANGYGMLSDEQKRIIAAIFDNSAQVPSSLVVDGVVRDSRWTRSVFGAHNQIDPLSDKDVWSTSRK